MVKLVFRIVVGLLLFGFLLAVLQKCADKLDESLENITDNITGIFGTSESSSTSTTVINQTTIQNINIEVNNIQQQVNTIEQSVNIAIKNNIQTTLLQQYTELNQYLVTVNIRINELKDSDNPDAAKLLRELKKLQKQIKKLIEKIEAALNQKPTDDSCYYAIGTESKLIEANVIKKNWLGQLEVIKGNNPFYISSRKSMLGQIPLYAKEGEVLSDMPSSSYELREINSLLVLNIKDTDKFWSKTNYLVVVTK